MSKRYSQSLTHVPPPPSPEDSDLVDTIVQHLKLQGIFDNFRRECISDVDTKPSFQNLRQRVEGYVLKFLSQQKWNQNLNKNQLRERLRRQINESGMLKHGIEHLVDQIVNPKINSLFLPKIESVVKEFLGIQDTPEPIVDEVKNTQQENSEVKQESETVKVEENKEKQVYEELKETVKQEIVEPQPMDIATDSEGSNDATKITFSQKTSNENDSDDKESWPTPPKPEMFTPERSEDSKDDQKFEINQNEEYKKDSEQNDENNEKSTLNIDSRKENIIVRVEDSEKTINVPSSSKTNIEDAIKKEKVQEEIKIKNDKKVVQGEKKIIKEEKKVVQEEKKVAKQGKKIVKDEKKIAKEKVEMKQDDYLSDVSSVHTSDLSDFDDEISLSSGDEEEAKKKKISLKVVKEITSGKNVSEDKSKKEKSTNEKTSTKRKEKDEKAESSDVKRKRKVNPKYTSEEYSSIYTKKRDGLDDDSENSLQSIGSLNEKTKINKSSENVQSKKMSKKRAHQSFDKESDDSNQHNKPLKIGRKKSEEQIEKEFTRSSSRASVESKSSSISESTQDSNPSQSAKRKISKSRLETQAQQRYDASDLYKPRPMISSRRSRGPPSSDNPSKDSSGFMIHDLSK